MHKMAVLASVALQIFKMGDDEFSPLDIQKAEKEYSGQIISIDSIEDAISDYRYIGCISYLENNLYKFDMSKWEWNTEFRNKKT